MATNTTAITTVATGHARNELLNSLFVKIETACAMPAARRDLPELTFDLLDMVEVWAVGYGRDGLTYRDPADEVARDEI
ncbi:hypothetical protein [Sinorhizobium sp. RAC02]|uniref:hypothetical protein n=1 Tax=Sinorhizobium sp. RAC02 TaxID=1842534 RepID=UPI00083D8E70|nr:hypothetical protein [Sinorhizobium sp. RAC02]AOF90800.1 hypothetical protein BSY16_2305 [Sinorhizobium sp. RAC02]